MSTVSSSPPGVFTRERVPVRVPLWRESLAGLDWVALRTSPVFVGSGIPHGKGAGVVVIPGFLGTDHYLFEMYFWLRRIGYRSQLSNIGWNIECPQVLSARLHETVERAAQAAGGKVHLIGHSLGGVLARSLATRFPVQIASVTMLGSPIRGIRSHPWVLETASQVRSQLLRDPVRRAEHPNCYTGFCDCGTVEAMLQPFPASVPLTAIYTKTDGVVDWQVCLTGEAANDVEVTGTHVGLVVNAAVYEQIAHRLAAAERLHESRTFA